MGKGEVVALLGLVGGVVIVLRTFASVYLARLKQRGAVQGPGIQDERLERIEQAIDSIALEVERISEAQRFTTKLLAERGKGVGVRE
jgi:hypothetical protein